MAKQKKKRTKAYSGTDARSSRPKIIRVSAENRGPIKDWWVSHKRIVKPLLIAAGVVLAILLLIDGLFGLR